jgi:Holliday junction resolvase-like predicted endonuclease
MSQRMTPREQGDFGELSAMEWLACQGAKVYIPVFHSPDIDLIAGLGDQLFRVQVKTTMHRDDGGRWRVMISTRGGNQSWSGLVKYFDSSKCDYLFVHVGDGRRWLIPSRVLDCRSGLRLGGPKYSQFEVERGRPLAANFGALQSTRLGEYRSGQTGRPVKALAQPSQVRILPPPSRSPAKQGFKPSKYERRLGRSGQAVVNQKRRVTIPQSASCPPAFSPATASAPAVTALAA